MSAVEYKPTGDYFQNLSREDCRLRDQFAVNAPPIPARKLDTYEEHAMHAYAEWCWDCADMALIVRDGTLDDLEAIAKLREIKRARKQAIEERQRPERERRDAEWDRAKAEWIKKSSKTTEEN